MSISTKDKKLVCLIRHTVAEVVGEVLSDPDAGLELIPAVQKRLKKYQRGFPRRTISLEEIKRKYL